MLEQTPKFYLLPAAPRGCQPPCDLSHQLTDIRPRSFVCRVFVLLRRPRKGSVLQAIRKARAKQPYKRLGWQYDGTPGTCSV